MGTDATSDHAPVVRQLVQDGATAEVVGALESRGLRAILLKGAAIAGRLYDDPRDRPYDDADLLVEPSRFAEARRTLAELGFSDPLDKLDWAQPGHAHTWHRGLATIDLHHRLLFADDSSATWTVLSAQTRRMLVGGWEVEILADPALALVITAHAVQHGTSTKTLEDLRRAVAGFGPSVWNDAAMAARALRMEEVFGAGLRRLPQGDQLARELDLPERSTSAQINYRLAGAPPLSGTLIQLSEADSLPAFLRILAHKLVPPPDFMRFRWPAARRSRLALVLAYVHRPLELAHYLPAAVRQWRAVRPPSNRC